MPKLHLKETSSFDADSVSKVFQNEVKKAPKMLGRNCANRPKDPFGEIKAASWSQRRLHSPSSSSFWLHMEANWTPFSPSASCSDIIARAILVGKPQCTAPITGFLVRNLLIGAQPCTHPHCSSFNTKSQNTPHTSVLMSPHLKLSLRRLNSARINANKHMHSESMSIKHVPIATGKRGVHARLCSTIQHCTFGLDEQVFSYIHHT